MIKALNSFFATWFYLGYIPFSPGTWGSLGGMMFIYLYSMLCYGVTGNYILLAPYIILGVILFGVGIVSAGRFDADHNTHDSSMIVVDEVVGIMVACLPMVIMAATRNAPLGFGHWAPPATAFVLFRVFDIWKPWPISHIDKHTPGGLGVMVDDIIAGAIVAVLFIVIGGLYHVFA